MDVLFVESVVFNLQLIDHNLKISRIEEELLQLIQVLRVEGLFDTFVGVDGISALLFGSLDVWPVLYLQGDVRFIEVHIHDRLDRRRVYCLYYVVNMLL